MEYYKKTFLGSIIAFALSISCCWISSLMIWFGGLAFLGVMVEFMENIRLPLVIMGSILGIVSIFLFLRNIGKKDS